MFITALFLIANTWKQSKYPSPDDWLKNMQCVCVCVCTYTYTCVCVHIWNIAYLFFSWLHEILPSHKKEKHAAICGYMVLVAQTVKRLPAMQETWVWPLGCEDPLEKEMATHSSTLAWQIPWMGETGGYSPLGGKESDTTSDFPFPCGSMDEPMEYCTWWNVGQRSKGYTISLICGVKRKNRNRLTNIENKHGYWKDGRGEINRECEINR